MMTAAGSMRNLAALVGVSHQRIGRGLREGQVGGVVQIPEAASEAIDTAFQIYKDVAIDQARATGFPIELVEEMPIYQYTKPRRDGSKPDRMFVDHAQFLTSETRTKLFEKAAATRKFQAGTVESEANTQSYLEQLALREMSQGKHRGRSLKWVVEHLRKVLTKSGFINSLGAMQKIKMRTPRAPLGPIWVDGKPRWDDPYLVATDIESKLLEKHAPSANQPGGTLASGFIFQLAPDLKGTTNAAESSETDRKARRKKWSNKRGK